MKITNLLSSASINEDQISRGDQAFALRGAPNSSGEGTTIACDCSNKDITKTQAPICVVAGDNCAPISVEAAKSQAPNEVVAEKTDDKQYRSIISLISSKLPGRSSLFTIAEDHPAMDDDSDDDTDDDELSCEAENRISSTLTRIHTTMSKVKQDVKKSCGVELTDTVVRRIEGAAAYVVALSETQSLIGAISVTMLYIQTHTSTSITRSVCNLMDQIFKKSKYEAQDSNPEWLEMMKNMKTNWRQAKNCQMFKELSNLLGLFVVAGMCEASQVTFTVKGFKLFAPKIMDKHTTAFDVVDAICETTTFFVEKMYFCYKTGSFTSLFIDDNESLQLDEAYAQLQLQWSLVRSGNLESVMNITTHKFARNMEDFCNKIKVLLKTAQGLERRIFQGKYTAILQMINDYAVLQQSAGVRESPFTIELFGESSQGKTTFGDQLTDALLAAAGLDYKDKSLRAPYNPSEEFMSTWKSDKLVMQIDDLCNTKGQFVSKPPTQAIIDICNNQPFVANMADLSMKGNVMVQPKLVIVSTNKKDLDAGQYSNCPYSIQRRMHVVITVRAKDEFQYIVDGEPQGIDPKKVHDFKEMQKARGEETQFDDIWSLTAEVAVKPIARNVTSSDNGERTSLRTDRRPSIRNNHTKDECDPMTQTAGYRVLEYEADKGYMAELRDVDMKTIVPVIAKMFVDHLKHQRAIIEAKQNRGELDLCGIDGCTSVAGYCHVHTDEDQDDDISEQDGVEFGNYFYNGLKTISHTVVNPMISNVIGFGSMSEKFGTDQLVKAAFAFHKSWDWMRIVPESWVCDDKFQSVMLKMNEDKLLSQYQFWTILHCLIPVLFKVFCSIHGYAQLGWVVFFFTAYECFIRQWNLVDVIKARYCDQLIKRNTISPTIQVWRDRYAGKLIGFVGVLGMIYLTCKLYNRFKKPLHENGSLEPKTQEEIEQRDSEVNVWTSVVPRDLPMSVTSKTTTNEQLIEIVSKNLVYGSIHDEDGRIRMVNGLFVRSNVVVIPTHYFRHTPKMSITFRKKNPEAAGGKFVTVISRATSYDVPNTDLTLCYSPTGGSFKDITRWFPEYHVPNHEFAMVRRDKSGEITIARGLGCGCLTGHVSKKFMGVSYINLSINTFNGLCGAVLISRGSGSCITGIHVGGKDGTPDGCACTVTEPELLLGYQELDKLNSVVLTGDPEHFDDVILGKKIVEQGEVHVKSPLRYMPDGTQITYFGQCPGAITPSTDVKKTLISEKVTEVTGAENIYRPPVIHPSWYGWQTCLSEMSLPGRPFDPEVVEIAARDYKEALIPIMQDELWRHSSPLNYNENMMGIRGKKFMDAIKMGTSIGFPLTGPKREYIEECVDDEGNLKREFLPVINEEIERCEECYRNGQRAFPIAKACIKDEILAKDKCRIFYSNPISLTFLVRKYFLPILRVLQMNPLISECAVGINCHGPEWQEFYDHVMTFGDDKIIGGDYGKYDQKLPSQIIIAALRVLIDLASECNYTEDDLSIMKAMVGDIAYAVIAFNGDLIGLMEGSHISGNSLTTILNGISGSLNLRVAFYTFYPCDDFTTRKKFRDFVKLMTYGDDNIGTASAEVSKFTIKNVSKFLEEYGQTYTMPDKESELTDYLDKDDFEFLKRVSVYCPKREQHVGALVDKSIYKSLHCYMRSKKGNPLTEEMACAANIDTALGEWFNHGEEKYEMHRQQMTRVAKESGIEHLCSTLNRTYDDRVEDWKVKYLDGYEKYEETFEYDLQ